MMGDFNLLKDTPNRVSFSFTKKRRTQMEKYFNTVSVAFGIFGGAIAWLLGGWDVLLWTLTAFVILDYLTGLMRAWKQKELSSEIGFEGLVKKIMIFTLVIVANFLQNLISESIPLREK